MPNALDFFAEGKAAFFFGYKYQEAEIKSKIRGFEYGIAAMPQINLQNETNYANYWTYTVSKKTKNSNEAWDFLQYASSDAKVKTYLQETGQSSVLRSLINGQLADPDQSVIANQALTAKSWYHGKKPKEAEQYFSEMIQAVVSRQADVKTAVAAAAKKIQEGYE